MKKIKIKIVIIGNPAAKVNCKNLSKWSSILFEIEPVPLVILNFSETDFDGLHLSNQIIIDLFNNVNTENDLIVGITDRLLDKDWFTQRISSKSFVISFFKFEEILKLEHIPLENFILRFIYPFSLIYLNNNNSIPENAIDLIHCDSQRCIFDFMHYKIDVLPTLIKPIISDYSKAKLNIALPENGLNIIEKELKKLNIPLFYRINKWINRRPFLIIVISGLFALILNILASLIYRYFY